MTSPAQEHGDLAVVAQPLAMVANHRHLCRPWQACVVAEVSISAGDLTVRRGRPHPGARLSCGAPMCRVGNAVAARFRREEQDRDIGARERSSHDAGAPLCEALAPDEDDQLGAGSLGGRGDIIRGRPDMAHHRDSVRRGREVPGEELLIPCPGAVWLVV